MKDKTILITGGTGSFGKKFTENIINKYKSCKVIIFSRDELKQFDMENHFQSPKVKYIIGDVRDKDRVNQAMRNVDIVIHAAALKQVPATEFNPSECLKTNIRGAENIIDAAINNKVQKVIALSTDKAGNPINLYGASKLVSDKLFIAANYIDKKSKTKFSVVRYGNVVGSRGSVVPFFNELINNKSKFLPVTDERMTRFWITLQEGVDFVLRNFKRMRGGEIFVPKIPSVKIIDLARAMAPKLKIKIIGIRPGEKINETMCPPEISHLTLEFKDHFVICPSLDSEESSIYIINNIGEKGKKVKYGFEYSSESNPVFLSKKEILKYNINFD